MKRISLTRNWQQHSSWQFISKKTFLKSRLTFVVLFMSAYMSFGQTEKTYVPTESIVKLDLAIEKVTLELADLTEVETKLVKANIQDVNYLSKMQLINNERERLEALLRSFNVNRNELLK